MNLVAKTITDSMHYCQYFFYLALFLSCMLNWTDTRHGYVTRAGDLWEIAFIKVF